jgi:hypothetical protein
MANLKLYKDATPGGTDGVEITGIGSDIIEAKGIYVGPNDDAGGSNYWCGTYGVTLIMLCLRCVAGYNAQSVTVAVSDTTKAGILSYNGPYATGCWTSEAAFTSSNKDDINASSINIGTVQQTNIGFMIGVKGRWSENLQTLQDVQLNVSFTEVPV